MFHYMYKAPYGFGEKVKRLVWKWSWFCLARPFPRTLFMPWKRFLLRVFGAKIANTAVIYAEAHIFMPWKLIMCDYACLGPEVDCYNADFVVLHRCAIISQRAYLCTASHNISSRCHEQIEKRIIVAERAWVAAEAFIGPGVIVGEGAVVGARAAVFKNVEPWTVVGGNPARIIKKRIIREE